MTDNTLDPVLPNAGVEARYQARLEQIVTDLNFSVNHQIAKEYQPIRVVAMDRLGADALRDVFALLARYWSKRLNAIAPGIATETVKGALNTSDTSFQAALRRAGFTVRFQMTATMRNAYRANVAQNVALIKSIGSQYLTDVEGAVMRSVAAGRDLGTLSNELVDRYQITRRRAALIATHQNNLATATFNKIRAIEAGFTTAVWRHSHAGNYPRASHVAAAGKEYDIARGCLIDGQFIQPGELINCKCFSKVVVPGLKQQAA